MKYHFEYYVRNRAIPREVGNLKLIRFNQSINNHGAIPKILNAGRGSLAEVPSKSCDQLYLYPIESLYQIIGLSHPICQASTFIVPV